jgi:hypothetical protein
LAISVKLLVAATLLIIPALIDLGVVSWIAQFRIDSTVREDDGMGGYLAAVRARNTRSSYNAEGQKRLPIVWSVGLLRVGCMVGAGLVLVS